ncbi:class I SAM-dependent methyltransferase [Microlunatus speluncae]|uniref:class I SAM-dependent methyltransferase n=1 Tax=Microlunatus speluncae TaxID=2594267 RepID=UPI0012666C05|nr:class I SAM-dependent methyltransferase [Microlunatus speluncae]
MSYDATIYAGTAQHYRFGRPRYSRELRSTLTELCRLDSGPGLDGTGRLLDVGCGPGSVTVPLADLFDEAVGIDPDPDMLREAARFAAFEHVGNLRWLQTTAEDAVRLEPGPFRLITFGQSFWWTDRERVAEAMYDLLEPGGCLALISHCATDRPRPIGPDLPPIPHDAIKELLRRYLGSDRRAGQGLGPQHPDSIEDALSRTRFGRPEQHFAPGRPDIVRNSDSVIAGYLSMSSSAPHLFGPNLDHFRAAMTDLLQHHSPTARFWDWPGDTQLLLARKPATPM